MALDLRTVAGRGGIWLGGGNGGDGGGLLFGDGDGDGYVGAVGWGFGDGDGARFEHRLFGNGVPLFWKEYGQYGPFSRGETCMYQM